MGFERMRIPLIRNFSGTGIPGSSRSRAKSKPRNQASEQSQCNSGVTTSVATAATATVGDTILVSSETFSTPLLESQPPRRGDVDRQDIDSDQSRRQQLPLQGQRPDNTLRLEPAHHLRLTPPTTQNSPHSATFDLNRHDLVPIMPIKLWVKRPGASPTRVVVADDDLVDNVRDVIIQKYANSLGRSIDSPDITLKIVSRDHHNKGVANERALGPEESILQTLEAYYPGGQTIDEALIIDVLSRRTPRPSPRPESHHHASYFVPDNYRPDEATARDYFPPMSVHSPHMAHVPHVGTHVPVHSMAVLTGGQLPALPSPGGHNSRRSNRPKYGRQHTSSPTIVHSQQPPSTLIDPKQQLGGVPSAAPLPTPPAPSSNEHNPSITPPNRASSPHGGQRSRKKKMPAARSTNGDLQAPPKPASASLLDGTVPPINVLIVEDNVINLKLLEMFMKRLKVRWKSAMNGKEAVATWRTGGFHLVLMDIQLPVMNGLEATKEIRRLEAVNGIGVFGGGPVELEQKALCNGEKLGEEDALPDRNLFKSPVIIVALTASSLQSDRHEALAAGCNDFLTKPVNFVWMERKVTEWGCMQALIDFDGWRKWKAFATAKENEDPAKKAAEEKEEKAKAKAALKAMFARRPPGGPNSSSTTTPASATNNNTTTTTTTARPKKEEELSPNSSSTSTTPNTANNAPSTNPTTIGLINSSNGHHNSNGALKKPAPVTSRGHKNSRSMGNAS